MCNELSVNCNFPRVLGAPCSRTRLSSNCYGHHVTSMNPTKVTTFASAVGAVASAMMLLTGCSPDDNNTGNPTEPSGHSHFHRFDVAVAVILTPSSISLPSLPHR